MENAIRYVRSRDRQRRNPAVAVRTSTSSSTSSTVSSSSASVSASTQGPRAASQFAAFVSGRRSLSAVEMQAKIKKLVVSQPAFPASCRPALTSKQPEESTDEELVQLTQKSKNWKLNTSEVQALLSLLPPPPPPPSTSSLPQRADEGSAGPEEPTDEELMEASQEPHAPLALPAAPPLVQAPPPPPPPPPAAMEQAAHPPPPAGDAEVLNLLDFSLSSCSQSLGEQLSLQSSSSGSAGCCFPGTAGGGHVSSET
ncbi:uncharacterized protein LOC110970629 [Acanthochromis polyacanthus]|uniref:uncharacterized protein LOC110970629 n=1 Tax=Acanthochromis polyacanthus TaxID=80966 RepID=UPI002234D6BF|nr:uncharacterized protein LOC110970629 [Acanthochromis polyacanthus]